MIDNGNGGFYSLVLENQIIDGVLFAEIIGCFLQAGQDEDIEIGDIFISDVALGIGVFDPLAACVAAEQDEHMGGRELLTDYLNDEL